MVKRETSSPRLIDLFVVSGFYWMLAGDKWKFVEPDLDKSTILELEGIAVASLYMFLEALFRRQKGVTIWLMVAFLGQVYDE